MFVTNSLKPRVLRGPKLGPATNPAWNQLSRAADQVLGSSTTLLPSLSSFGGEPTSGGPGISMFTGQQARVQLAQFDGRGERNRFAHDDGWERDRARNNNRAVRDANNSVGEANRRYGSNSPQYQEAVQAAGEARARQHAEDPFGGYPDEF